MQTRWRVFKNINAYSYRKGTLETTPFITVRANNDIDASTLELIGVEDFLRAGEPDGWHAATWTQTNHPDGEPITTTQKYVFSKLTAENTLEDNTPPDGDARWALSSLASIHDDYKPDAVRDIVIWSMSDGSFQVGTNTGASTDLIWQKSTKEDISQRMGGKINARGEGLKVDKLWRNGKWHPLTEFVDTTQWTNIRGVDINSSGYILVKADEVGESATKTNVPLLLLPVDIDIIKPGTEDDTNPTEIAENLEDWDAEKKEGGWVASLNWDDDDNDGGAGGHGKLIFTNDFDDEDGTKDEDDLLQLKVHRIAVENVKGRLKFDATNFRVWKKKDRTEEVKTEDTEFDIKKDEDLILYVEGKKITEAEAPKKVELQIKVGNQADFQQAEDISLHVATPIIYAAGVWGRGFADEALDVHGRVKLLRIDERNGSLIVKGKNIEEKLLFYSVDIFHVDKEGDGRTANTTIRGVNLDKELKMAMGVSGAHVIYSGHANYGLGPNFTPENVGATNVDDYMNISSHGLAAINLRAVPIDSNPDDPDPGDIENTFKDIEHGGPNFSLRENDVPDNAENKQVLLTGTKRWPGFPDALSKKMVGTHPYHYKSTGNTHVNWYTVVKSTGDKPPLRYASCFMNACSSGRHYGMDLRIQGKVFFYSTDSCLASQYGDDNDIYASTFYIQSLIKGEEFIEIKASLNGFENVWSFKQ